MSTETKETRPSEPAESNEVPLMVPRHLLENFERANQQIQQHYDMNPGVPVLARLWLASCTSSQIRVEFELAALDVTRRDIEPHPTGEFDDDCLV